MIMIMALIPLLGTAQNTREVKLTPFEKIDICCAIRAELIPSAEDKVQVIGEENGKETVQIAIEGTTVKLKNKGNISDDVKVKVYFTQLKNIEVSGAGEVKMKELYKTETLIIDGSGASDLYINAEVNKMDVNLSGASDMKADGKINTLKLDLSGASEIKATAIEIQDADIEMSGASEAVLDVKNNITGNLSGTSELKLKKAPLQNSVNTSGVSEMTLGSINMPSNTQITLDSNEIKVINDSDTTRIKLGKYKMDVYKNDGDKTDNDDDDDKDDFSHSWSGFDIGINGMLYNNSPNMPAKYDYIEQNYGRSWNFALNFLERDININKEYVNIVTGMGIEFANYNLRNNYILNSGNGLTAYYDSATVYDKNKLRASYLNVPLLIEFNTSSNYKKSFHVAVGVVGGVRLGTSYKLMHKVGGNRQKSTNRDDYAMQDLKAMATIRIGYGNYTMFANYGLTDLFVGGKGPNVAPVTVGVTLIPFN